MQISLERLSPFENSTYLVREYIQSSFTSPRHYHQEFELAYIEESHGKLYVGNSIVDFTKGDLFLFAPRLIHCFKNPKDYEQSEGPARATCLWFAPDLIGREFMRRPQSQKLITLYQKAEFGVQFPKQSNEVIEILKSISSAKNLDGIINILIILNKLSLQKSAKILSETMLNKYYYKHSDDDRIDKVMDHAIRNSHKRITLKEIAGLVNMSEAGFSRFFKSRTEKNFTGFINEIRLSRARRLLIETNKSIHEISLECGYDNLSYFNRQFKAYNNLSPKVFREYFINTNSTFE
jgi:AraC-like DNA-binding protein